MRQTFRRAAEKAGLNPYMVEIANIREQCSWIHKEMKQTATEKAVILGRAAIAKVHLNAPLTAGESPVTKRALVIGGGIAGIQTALDIADAGFDVDIVAKKPTIGGKMAQIDKTFPTLDCAACILALKMVDCAQNDKINIYAYSEVEDISGFVGNFSRKGDEKRPAMSMKQNVPAADCVPKNVLRKTFLMNLTSDLTTAAPYIFRLRRQYRKKRRIDPDYCTMLKTGKCGVCSKLCVQPEQSTTSKKIRL